MRAPEVTRREALLLALGLAACRDEAASSRQPQSTASAAAVAAGSAAGNDATTSTPTSRPSAVATAPRRGGPADMPAAAATSAPATSVAKDKPKESPHVLTVPAADIETGSPETYTVTADGHSHQVVVDGPAMAKLKASRFALVRSELGGPNPHRHWVSVYAG